MARAGLTVERIVTAAAEMADEVGLDHLNLSALARRFGVKDASLYSHIRGLADLRTRLCVLAAREMTDRIALAVAGRAGKEALFAFADAYRAYALEHPGRYAAGQLRIDPQLAAASAGHRRSVELTHGMLRAYGLAEPDLTDAGRLLRSTFHGYADLESRAGFSHPRTLDASWHRALEALHILLENWPRQAGPQQPEKETSNP
ncbi:TetR/AcrR family transcriptional regulator [Streptomyces albus]|uniref:TetR/AcrR family transcriptional regulator n=2 Tax=Streptomyces albus TaxID=1888 RepID=A0A6C1C4S9_9ACTN|nr:MULTISPECIES: TetR-like C-terminal domain-containing protein [Streptomyces]KPC92939.1 TetR family transcriptional regulator [Streptomyces sp. NRRL F-6602]QID37924.1 TetR/AcrR family transcriptional regulator [Streptomyces albus]TGG75651.1 TetR/AcrR family transcriptional regulator [Streptomyces albus]UVN55104.1 WHG domain-containing protein [Streptomyces albus]GHJ19380.1 transcriptional regulator [Streptomyces albus]